jgi:hypothetical protein
MNLPSPPPTGTFDSATGAIVGMSAILTVINFLTVPLLSGTGPGPGAEVIIGAWMGIATGQFGLVAMWGVLAPQKLLHRLGVSLLLGAILATSFGLGLVAASAGHGPPSPGEIPALFGFLLLLPLIVASVQVPLWVAKLFWGWQVAHVREVGSLSRAKQFSIAQMLTATALIAVLLALNQPAGWLLEIPPRELWLQTGLSALCALVLSALSTPPAVYAVLRCRQVSQGCLAIGAYAFLFAFVLCVIIASIARGMPGEVVVIIFGYFAGLALTLTLPLLVLRNFGFRLVIGNPSPEQAETLLGEQIGQANVQ